MQANSHIEQRQQFWTEHITNQLATGQSVRAYCRQQSLAEHSFYSWRRRLRSEPATPNPVRFAVLDAAGIGAQAAAIRIQLATGDRIEITPGADQATLRMVIALLRQPQEPR
jgi:hypothetical protein